MGLAGDAADLIEQHEQQRLGRGAGGLAVGAGGGAGAEGRGRAEGRGGGETDDVDGEEEKIARRRPAASRDWLARYAPAPRRCVVVVENNRSNNSNRK